MTPPDLSEERPVCDPEAPNPNPVEAGPAVAPKDENGKFDPTKIADVSDFGDWEEQGCKGYFPLIAKMPSRLGTMAFFIARSESKDSEF